MLNLKVSRSKNNDSFLISIHQILNEKIFTLLHIKNLLHKVYISDGSIKF